MGKQPTASDGANVPAGPAKDSSSLVLVSSIADTTWRMFVPTVGFTLLGVWGDSILSTKPWLMFAGIVVGVIFAVLLVRRQIQSLKKDSRV